MGQIGKPQNAPRQYRAYILGHVKGAPFALLCQFVELFALDADAGQHRAACSNVLRGQKIPESAHAQQQRLRRFQQFVDDRVRFGPVALQFAGKAATRTAIQPGRRRDARGIHVENAEPEAQNPAPQGTILAGRRCG